MIATQHSLVARLRVGVSNADWQRFYSLYAKPILAFASARSLSDADCSDVLQETMVKMLQGGFARFDASKGRFTSFLFHVANYAVIDAIRRRARFEGRQVSLDNTLLIDNSATPLEAAELQGQIVLLHGVLDALVEHNSFHSQTIALFKAVTLEMKDPREVALSFNTTTGNVYQARHAVLHKLRAVLQALDRGLDFESALAAAT